MEMIRKRVKQNGGQVKGSFNRPDIGDLDVVWGVVTDLRSTLRFGVMVCYIF
ncbi:hypothetical protein J2Z29_000804 [Treponema pedis]